MWTILALCCEEVVAQNLVCVDHRGRIASTGHKFDNRLRGPAVTYAPAVMPPFECLHCRGEFICQITRSATLPINLTRLAATELCEFEFDQSVIGVRQAAMVEQRVLSSGPATDEFQMQVPKRPHAINVEECAKVAAGRPYRFFCVRECADRSIEEVGVPRSNPPLPFVCFPERPPSWFNIRGIRQGNKKNSSSPAALQYQARSEEP